MAINIEELILAILWYASSRGEKLTTLRLVKFLYLADLYYARYAKGKILTEWPWAFVYFGPWCKEANDAINRATETGLIFRRDYPSKFDDDKDYRLYWAPDSDKEPKIIEMLPTYVWSRLQWAIQKWADDSSGLLDYVYFETEPMIQATPGALLNFRLAHMPELPKKIDIKKIPSSKVTEAKTALERLRDKYRAGVSTKITKGPTDAVFREFLSKLDESDLEIGLEGTASLADLHYDQKS
jgi:hypothetical protein